MKPIEDFLSSFDDLNIKIRFTAGRLLINAPKGGLTENLKAELADRKYEIINFLQQMSPVSETDLTLIQPVNRKRNLPLSFAQQRLWFLEQYDPGSSLYHIPSAIRLIGDLNIKALEKSFQTIVDRHESLRTSFETIDGEPFQNIQEDQIINLPIKDLSNEFTESQKEEIQHLILSETQKPFDFSTDTMLRARLIKLKSNEHILIIVMHHIASDGWSMGIFWKELSALYNAYSRDEPSPLPDLPVQYADFTIWQRDWLQGDVLDDQLSYWKKQLDGAPEILELPADHPRPRIQTHKGAHLSFTLPEEITLSLIELSKQEGVTLFMTLLSAFKILLFRYSNQEDVLVGTPIANRNKTEIEGLIGFFVNTLVIRSNLSGNPNFKNLLRRIKEVCLAAYTHQDLPFEKLVEELQPQRNMSHSPLFQVMFILQNTPKHNLELTNLTLIPEKLNSKYSNFDLTLSMTANNKKLTGNIEFNSDLLEAGTINSFMEHYQNLLNSIISNPEQHISTLSLFSDTEYHQIVKGWNNTKTHFLKNMCLHRLFEAQVKKKPEAIAAIFEDKKIDYLHLNFKANQLAHYLIKKGVGPDMLVGVCLERSIECVIGILGILKAGGAYVPLDPEYPRDRLGFMMKDSRVAFLLTQEKLKSTLSGSILKSCQVILIDTEWEQIKPEQDHNPNNNVNTNNLAYVIYTSGSTGKPKGVMIPHRCLCNHMSWMSHSFPLNPTDKVLLKTSISFDASIWELFTPLVAGAQLIIAKPDLHLDINYIISTIVKTQITMIQLVPSLLQSFIEYESFKNCQSLKHIFSGGEELTSNLKDRYYKMIINAKLHNTYGPTETTIDAIYWACKQDSPFKCVPIGRPISNTEAYILNPHLALTPVGVPGELYLGGENVGLGYFNQPELTAKKFVPNPFNDKPKSLLYKTGDLARYLPDGNIEYLGRLDYQVKIRGFRIELEEIESVLKQHSDVVTAIVLAKTNNSNNTRLVAYIKCEPKQKPTIISLRGLLKEILPNYMIPSFFIFLENFPLLSNGKINRKALPEPDQSRPLLEDFYEAPQTPYEKKIAEIWKNLLGFDQIGINDNFFDLGGHSLLATQLTSRIRKIFHIDIPLRCLFEKPTIKGLIYYINQLSDIIENRKTRIDDSKKNREEIKL